MKKTKERKQYSDPKIRILQKPNHMNIRKKELIKICKSEGSKTTVPYYVEYNQLQIKNFKGK